MLEVDQGKGGLVNCDLSARIARLSALCQSTAVGTGIASSGCPEEPVRIKNVEFVLPVTSVVPAQIVNQDYP